MPEQEKIKLPNLTVSDFAEMLRILEMEHCVNDMNLTDDIKEKLNSEFKKCCYNCKYFKQDIDMKKQYCYAQKEGQGIINIHETYDSGFATKPTNIKTYYCKYFISIPENLLEERLSNIIL